MRLDCLVALPMSVGASVENNAVRVKLFPYSDYELVPRRAASHLFRLLQRYNWALEDAERYRERWAAFWPAIGPVQRQLLSLFVMSNSEGIFGRRLEVVNPPVEFEPLIGMWEAAVLQPETEQAFRWLLTDYFSHLVCKEEVAERWMRDCTGDLICPPQDALLELLFSHEVGLHADLFIQKSIEAMGDQVDASERMEKAMRLSASLTQLMREKEPLVWSLG